MMHDIKIEIPQAVLCGVSGSVKEKPAKEQSLQELHRLAETAGIEVKGKFIQNKQKVDKTYYLGKGFLAEVVGEMQELKAEIIIFDNELSASQARNIERDFEIKVIDRTEVILDIFHKHAASREAKLQVRLAELNYQLPRLKKLWSHLDREKGQASGSGGTSRGMGEKQIEVDKRLIRSEIRKVTSELAKVDTQKETQRKSRQKSKKICLVGYTNAGKSTLFNKLTGADVLVQDKLFATLDSTAKNLELEKGKDVILSDTVGFISDLPHHLVASFKATLKDVEDADLLLHVVDFSDPNFLKYIEEVQKVLAQIEAAEIPQIMVLNKMDQADQNQLSFMQKAHPQSVGISAKTGENLAQLLQQADELLHKANEVEVLIPHSQPKVLNLLFSLAKIISKEYTEAGLKAVAIINQEDRYHFEEYILEKK
ncbi:MAG: GTPase HflX [Candidatus Cloacimonadales bacterium]